MTNPALIWDCSAAIAMAFEDERDEYARRALWAVSHEGALVPAHWPMEIVNVLRVAERRKRIEPAASREFLRLLGALPIQIEDFSGTVGGMVKLYESAERFSLTSYDAAYLQLALKSGLPLASKDSDLNKAASRAGVALFI
jgi:predicted nucleic acid-binding protein